MWRKFFYSYSPYRLKLVVFNSICFGALVSGIIGFVLEAAHYRRLETALCKRLKSVLCGGANVADNSDADNNTKNIRA